MTKKLNKRTPGKKEKATAEPKRKPVRSLTIMEMSDGTIDLNLGGMEDLEAIGWITMYVDPVSFVKSVRAKIQQKKAAAQKKG
jgi:hypothetical protein